MCSGPKLVAVGFMIIETKALELLVLSSAEAPSVGKRRENGEKREKTGELKNQGRAGDDGKGHNLPERQKRPLRGRERCLGNFNSGSRER